MYRRIPTLACALGVTLLAFNATAHAQLIVGQENEFEPVYHIDTGTLLATPLFVPADNGVDFAGIEGLTVDDVGRTIYFTAGTSSVGTFVFSAHYDDPDPDFPGRLRVRRVAELAFAGEVPRVTGLAWDSIGNRLLTSYQFGLSAVPEGIYEVDLNTGAMTLLLDFDFESGDVEFSGLDFNPLDGFLYANNLDFSFRFLNRIDLTQPAATARTEIATGALVSNEEGLAVTNGDCGPGNPGPCDNLAYLIPDDTADLIRVFNLATETFEPDLGLTPFANSTSQSGGGWGPNALSPTPGPNFCLVTSALPASGSDVAVGDSIDYMIRNQNCGNEDALTGGVYTITLSGPGAVGATIDSVVSDSGLAMETIPDVEVSATLVPVAAGATENVMITVTTASEGELIVTANFEPVDDDDAYDPNNTESLSHNVRVFPTAGALASTVAGTTSAIVPGLGVNYDSGLGRPNRSPDGLSIAFEASTDFGTTSNDDVIVRYTSGVGALISQENTTPVGPNLDDLFNEKLSVNNAGFVAYIADTTGTDDEFVVIADGVTRTEFAREDTVIPFSPFQENGWDYGSTLHSANINGNRDAIYCNEFMGGGISSSENTAVFRSDEFGNISEIVAWEGNTFPSNQAGGANEAWESFDDGDQWSDGALCQTLLFGDLTGTSGDDVLVVNGEVVMQEGELLAGTGLLGTIGSPSTTAGIIWAEMLSNGDWVAHGTTSDADEDWVVKGNGSTFTLVARQGDEIFPGAGEFWNDDSGLSYTYRGVAGNNQGDIAILGTTDNPDASKNYVCVINGTTEVIREGDPVALDADGLFDDNAFVGLPEADELVLTDDGTLYFTTQLVDNTGSDIGDAVVAVDVSAATSPIGMGADLVAIKSASTDVVEVLGEEFTYTITVCNVGPEDATNVVINDTLPAETTFSTGSNGAMEVMPGMVEINLGTVEAFTSTSATITVTATSNGLTVNSAMVSATEADPNPGNNTGTASTLIEARADVGVSKIDNGGAPVGMNYNYTVTVTNDGPSVATNVLVRDSLPAEVTFVTCSLPFVQNGQDIDVTIPSIPAGGSVMYDITVTPTFQALVTNNISILSLDQVDLNPANDSFMLETINGDVADMAITKTDEGLVNFGDDINYTIEIENLGPGPANNVVVTETLPAGVSLVSVSVPFNEIVPGVLELSFSTIAATTTETVMVTVTPNMTGSFTNTVDVAADEIDPDPANNSASVITRVGEFRQINVIYSEIDGHPTAVVPGALDLAGMPVVTEWKSIEEMSVSPDGSTWVVSGQNELSSNEVNSAVLGSGMVGTSFAQEGQQIPGEAAGTLYDFFDDDFGFNNNNDFAWGARARGTTTEDLLFTRIGGSQTTAVRESDPAFGLVDSAGVLGDETMGNSVSTAHLLDDNSLGFYAANIQGIVSSSEDTALFYSEFGTSTAFLQEGVSMFGGENVAAFTAEHFRTSPDGLNYIAEIGLGPDSLSDEEAVVVNDVVVLRQNTNFMGIDIDGIFDVRMIANGDWFVRGDDLLNDDYIVSNGNVIARTGDPITTGSAETWGDVMIAATGNANGDYLVIGNTSEPDTEFDTVMVLNGETVVAREGDPVDLDGNGMFDDNVFIGRGTSTSTAFSFDDVALTDDGLIYFISPIRDSEGNDLGTFGSGGEAFMTLDVSDLLSAGCPTIAGDVNGDGLTDGADLQGAVDCILSAGAMGGACSCLDYDMSGVSDLGDVADFVADLLN